MDKKKLRYAILKEIEKENTTLREDTFDISSEDFKKQVDFLFNEGYISKPMYADNIVYSMAFVTLKEKGEKYLDDNSLLSKTYKVAKELREWVRL